MSERVRVRFAPSPTGHLHIGGARTALYNWAYARGHQGTFVLRIDDTDAERSTQENVSAILSALSWLGIDWDEGPGAGGEYGPYLQSERGEQYARALAQLRQADAVYPCFCSPDVLAAKREAARARGGEPGYDRSCRSIDAHAASERMSSGEAHAWRLRIPEGRGDVEFVDAIRGPSVFRAETLDDLVVMRGDGTPTYNFATVVDDVDMAITDVIRGDDHLSNTPRQIMVFEALGATPPRFAHLSMIWGPDNKRLSKRHGATSVESYRDLGYLAEALINYLALLGWSLDDKTTVISRETLCQEFSLERVSRNPAVFDAAKLDWLNGIYLRELAPDAFVDAMSPWLVRAALIEAESIPSHREWLSALGPLVAERIKRLDEIAPIAAFLFADTVAVDPAARTSVLEKEGAAQALVAASEALRGLTEFTPEAIEEALRAVPERASVKPKLLFQAVRVAISGSTVSLPLFESLALLGQERSIERIQAARVSHAE